ncbi:hypothetical protein [Leptolyngbya sp. FACHB-8]|uniref:hypothetical protein n=1 Tax=unclassified Leptolyngbya TaxID=2650499 RepID=UPI001685F7B1|nr:hypothetical protein [Leptolyngbya sp. FACHB-8]MBD1911270.1 hypothetical protein [Leptolyngbya sp. FACHB-8]
MTAFQVGDRVSTFLGVGTIERINAHGELLICGDGEDPLFYGSFHPDEVQMLDLEVAT